MGGCASGPPEVSSVQLEPETPARYADFSQQSLADPVIRERVERWCQLMVTGTGYPDAVKLMRVNALINELEYIDDAPQWGQGDYWATPYELLEAGRGDCEDFSIAKYYTLTQLGVPESRLRLTYVKSVPLRRAHMVVTYFPAPGSTPLVLDNLNPEILPATRREDLLPVYSFNGSGLWLAKQRGEGKWIGSASRLRSWQDMQLRMASHSRLVSEAEASPPRERPPGLWQCVRVPPQHRKR